MKRIHFQQQRQGVAQLAEAVLRSCISVCLVCGVRVCIISVAKRGVPNSFGSLGSDCGWLWCSQVGVEGGQEISLHPQCFSQGQSLCSGECKNCSLLLSSVSKNPKRGQGWMGKSCLSLHWLTQYSWRISSEQSLHPLQYRQPPTLKSHKSGPKKHDWLKSHEF